METLIKGWIINLAAIAILGTLMDMILPNGSFRKYTRFILGIIVLALVLQPILAMFKQVPSLESYMTRYTYKMDSERLKAQSSLIKSQQDAQLQEAFADSLEGQIEDQVRKLKGYKDVRAEVVFREEQGQKDLTMIEQINLMIGDQRVSSIEPVEIEVSLHSEKDEGKSEAEEPVPQDWRDIQDTLSALYEIPKEKIMITQGE